MKLVYFAWIREKIGCSEEEITLPAAITTVAELIRFLQNRDFRYKEALKYPDAVRVAINHQYVEHDANLSGAREIALFPPMTGG